MTQAAFFAPKTWAKGKAPVAVVMIALNEGHNMEPVLSNLAGWAQEVFLVDSYSTDDTVTIALRHGIHVVQRRFDGFGSQWNFALRELPISAPWTMKLDPDERLSDDLKRDIEAIIAADRADAITLDLRLWFMGKRLPPCLRLLRLWRTGGCRFTDVLVNEHPLVKGTTQHASGDLEHHDSPNLHHWLEKQNRYTTAEAITTVQSKARGVRPRLFGGPQQRRLWIKRNFFYVPFRYKFLFLYHYLWLGAWRAGSVGLIWSELRCSVYRLWEYKRREIELTGRMPTRRPEGTGTPDPRVPQF